MRWTLSLMVLGGLVASNANSNATAAEGDHDPQLLMIARLIDRVPTMAQLQDAGVTDAALVAVLQDTTLERYARMRAASLLAGFDTDVAKQGLVQVLQDPRERDREVQIQAMAAWTALNPHRAVVRLQTVLTHADPELRAAAVRNLARVKRPEARRVLEARFVAGTETVPWIRSLLARKLAASR